MDTFLQWLTRQAHRQDEVGELAREVRADRRSGCLYITPTNKPVDLYDHMRTKHGLQDSGESMQAWHEALLEWLSATTSA